MADEWYYAKNKRKVGPLTEAQLKVLIRSGELSRSDMVWKEGMAKWVRAGQVQGLFEDGPARAVTGSIPPPLPASPEVVPVAARSTPTLPVSELATDPKEPWWKRLLHEVQEGRFGGKQVLPYELDPATRFPWPISERSSTNPKRQWAKIAAGVSGGIGVLLTLNTCPFGGPGIVVSWWFLVLSVLILVLGVYNGGRLHGRWLPVDDQPGWVEFLSGKVFKREDGTVGSFYLLKNHLFIDILVSGHLVDSWKILSWGTNSLEIQDMAGKARSYKKGKTLEEKKASLFHKDRTDDLPGSWVPIDGSGKWVQFTKDGAIVFSDGRAGRYTVTGEEPNEIIRVTTADGSTCEYRVMSLSKTQLGIVEGTEARSYSRHGQTKSGVASASQKGQKQGPPADTPADQGTSSGVGGVFSGAWNWLSTRNNCPCPECKSRNTKETGRTLQDQRQEVRTDWKRADGGTGYRPQAVFNVKKWEVDYKCSDCGDEWFRDEETEEMA